MRVARWLAVIGLLFALVCWLTLNLGLPPWAWIEKSRFVAKAEAGLATVASPTLPTGMGGDIFSYPDGWVVILYGQSQTTGHNLWNYNLAKDSAGHEYVSERHFCTAIRKHYDMWKTSDEYRLKSKPDAGSVPNPHNPELDGFKSLVEASTLSDASGALMALGFVKR